MVNDSQKIITIIGAGIAGLTTAYVLQQAGLNVSILNTSSTAMDKTSGNPSALLDARPVNDDTPHAVYNKLAFTTAYNFYDSLPKDVWAKRGLVKFPHSDREKDRFDKMLNAKQTLGSFDKNEIEYISQSNASKLLNITAPSDGLYFKNGGAVYPHKIRQVLSEDISITPSTVKSLEHIDDMWHITTDREILIREIVILATGHEINDLSPTKMVHTITRGQIARVTDLCQKPTLPVSMMGYTIPIENGYVLGATTQREDMDDTIRPEDFDAIAKKNAPITKTESFTNPIGRVGFRSNPANRMPWSLSIEENLYIVAGMGSRGFINAPLCASIIKAKILGQPAPINETVLQASLYEHYGI